MTRNWQALYAASATSTCASRRMSAACAWCRPSPTRSTSGGLFAHDNAGYRETKLDAYRIMAASTSLSYLSMRLIQLVVMIAGSYFVITGELSQWRLRQLPAAGQRLLPADREDQLGDRDLSEGHRRLPALSGAARHRARHRRPAGRDRGQRACAATSATATSTFGYSGERPVLKHVDLDIAAGETIAFVGPSGAGKTTICSLLPRFYEVERGRDHHRRHRHPRHDAGLAAQPDRHRPAGRVPVRRLDPREHRLWPARRLRGGRSREAARRARLDG